MENLSSDNKEIPITVNVKAGNAYLPAARAIVTFNNPLSSGQGKSSSDNGDGSKIIQLSDKAYEPNVSGYASWGLNNNLPQEIIDLGGKCGVLSAGILHNILSMVGAGIEFGKFVYVGGVKKFEPLDITDPKYSDVEDFFLASDIQDEFLLDSATDLVWFGNFYPYWIMNKGRNRLNKLYTTEATYTRLKVKDPKTFKISHVGVCTDWLSPKDIVEIPVLSDFDPLSDLKSRTGGYRFALPGYFPSPGRSYYQKPYWDAVRANGWVDIAIEIPKFTKSIFKHAMHLKYHVSIPDMHFQTKYKDWESKSEEDQLKLIEDELKLMNDFLSGSDNAMKTFVSFFAIDKITGKEIPGWKIEPIADYTKEGKYLPEGSAANSEILFALLTHPDLIGAGTPGGSYSSRGNSGSNTREADLLKKASMTLYRMRILKYLYHTKRFNNWNKELQFKIEDTVLTTLDNGSQAIKNIS